MARRAHAPQSGLGSLSRQADLESVVKFGPERSALREMLRQAIDDRDSAIKAAIGTNRGMQAAIGAARPELARSYGRAGEAIAGTRATLDARLGEIGGAASPFAAAIARERSGSDSRTQESLANALSDLSNRRIQSAAAVGYARIGAQGKFASDTGKIENRVLDLSREEGAFKGARVGELKKEEVDRAFQAELHALDQEAQDRRSRAGVRVKRESLDETKRHNRETEANGGEGGKKGLTKDQQNKLRGRIEETVSLILGAPRKENGKRPSDDEIRQSLRSGENPLGKPISDEVVGAAFELAREKYLSPESIRTLRSLGLHIPTSWRPPKMGTRGALTHDVLLGSRKVAQKIRLGK